MATRVYFDESGFTGNNLLHPQQRYFSYASVATDEEEARDFALDLIKKYRIQGGELKGKNLVKFSPGRKAIDDIFSRFENRIKISISDKKFALACKLHEYIFEPCFSDISTLFYKSGFHRFIANILYIELIARGAGAEDIFSEFEYLMRNKDEENLYRIFSSSAHPENSPIIAQIREFAQLQANSIRKELSSVKGSGAGKWVLDLTLTALYTLLANWSAEKGQISAVCDSSKPLIDASGLLDAMIDRDEIVFSDFFGTSQPITFNLSGPIEMADSKMSYGIQIADVLAAAAVHALSNRLDSHSEKWRTHIGNCGHYGSIIPDTEEVDLTRVQTQRNAILLLELHSRAKSGRSITEGMPEFLQLLSTHLQAHPLSLTNDTRNDSAVI